MNTTLPEYKTVQEAADLLRVSKKQVHNWIRDGKLRALKIGRIVRISLNDLRVFLGEGGAQ